MVGVSSNLESRPQRGLEVACIPLSIGRGVPVAIQPEKEEEGVSSEPGMESGCVTEQAAASYQPQWMA